MSSSGSSKETGENALQEKQSIPIQLSNIPLFGNAYAFMKEHFTEEMKRIDQQMTKFSTDLMNFYGQPSTMQTDLISSTHDSIASNWDVLTSSPLVQGEGDDKTLKLQFDVSQFDPSEVNVKLLKDMLVVSAIHEEKTNGAKMYKKYTREFSLPAVVSDPDLVVTSLSSDGVLTVEAPLLPKARKVAMQKQIDRS